MQAVITSILTDASLRDADAAEAMLMRQAVAAPWANSDASLDV